MASRKPDLICAYPHPDLVIESHSENMPSLRIDKPFPSLLQHAMSLDFPNIDPTDHGHIPYVIILVRVLEEWKSSVGGGKSIVRSSTDVNHPPAA